MKIHQALPKLFVLFFLILGMQSCDILQQTAQMQRLSLCKFDVNGVSNVSLAGISLNEGMGRSDLNAAQIMQLTNALFSNRLPLKLNLLINVDNPNDKTAALSRMDYSLIVDGMELITGQMDQRFEIGPGAQTVIPLPVEVDLFKVLSGQNADVVSNLGFKLTGSSSEPVELLFKVKPYINVGMSQLAYPGFIEVKHTL